MDFSIEIAVLPTSTTTDKGNLLEGLAKDLLEAQNYAVETNVRITATELDLLCKNKINGKEIYVECKAYRAPINAPTLRQLWGTVDCNEYAEGWLISTAEFGKDAKGFVTEWKKKPRTKSERLSFYTPNLVIEALERSNVIVRAPTERALELMQDPDVIGAWTLIVTPFGRFWVVYILSGGVADKALVFSAKTGKLITDENILKNLSTLDSPISRSDLTLSKYLTSAPHQSLLAITSTHTSVVEVQTGDSWNDYRPARSKDFVGRKEYLSEIFSFFADVQLSKTSTRIFSITGHSGLGKSSLIAQLREKSRNKSYKNKYFVFAVDVRGARGPNYIIASLLSCLQTAQDNGFGSAGPLKIENPDTPLSSESIQKFLAEIEARSQVICLVFDQFEELYSKPELFPVFEAAKNLMFEIAASKSNLCLGFAWKTDFTSQGDHPAYHMWHSLSDHRKNYKLDIFNSGEISASLTLFEKQTGQKIRSDLRHQISSSCQGFPWLLKKLCINLDEGIKKSGAQGAFNGTLDIAKLFQSDVEILTPPELTCLKLIAEKAPADWSEIIDIAGVSSLNGLIHKRLVVKSGDRLNIYWDIFRDYLISGKTPALPLNYIPTTDFSSFMKVAKALNPVSGIGASDLSNAINLNERTILNIGADLVMFGIAQRDNAGFKLAEGITVATESELLQKLRERFDSHSVKLELYKLPIGTLITAQQLINALKAVLPKANHDQKTWNAYAKRIARFLSLVGYLVPKTKSWTIRDLGSPVQDSSTLVRQKRLRGTFAPLSSPANTLETLKLIEKTGTISDGFVKEHRNSIAILRRFQLISSSGSSLLINMAAIQRAGGQAEALWTAAKNEDTLMKCVRYLQGKSDASAKDLGVYISNIFDLRWVDASTVRYGNVLRQWAKWLDEGIDHVQLPTTRTRKKHTK